MAGKYVAEPGVRTIRFREDSPLAGLTVVMRTRLGFTDIIRFGAVLETKQEPVLDADGNILLDEHGQEMMRIAQPSPDQMTELVEAAGAYLVSWNYEEPVLDEDGEPMLDEDGNPRSLPLLADPSGWALLAGAIKMLIFNEWCQHITKSGRSVVAPVPFVSPEPSPNGVPSPEEYEQTALV